MKRDMEGFLEKCEEAGRTAFSFSEPLIVHHYDADGISAGALVCGAFQKQGRRFRRKCIKKLDDRAVDGLAGEKEIIFADLGGGNKRVNELEDVLIIDHHQTEGIEKFQINPLLFGINGGDELSAAGAAYCIFREHVDLAVTGACGDMQHPLTGMNRWILERGVESGKVRAENDLRLYGRYCRPLVQFLAYCDDPYLPGISYREDRAMQFLADRGIPTEKDGKQRTYSELDEDEKKRLVSGIAGLLISHKDPGHELIGEGYVFPERPKNETYEANEFSTLLNACGRHSRPEVGVRVCLGDSSAYQEAHSLLQIHRRMLREGIVFARENTQDLGRFHFLDGRGRIDEGIIGIVCGMTMGSRKKPVIGIATGENDSIKASGRATRALVSEGVNISELMGRAAAAAGGTGGGHRIAAGASIPKGKLDEFLRAAGEYFG